MKKALSLLLACCLMFSCAFAEGAAQSTQENQAIIPSLWEEGQTHEIERKTFTLYVGTPDSTWRDEFPLYFVDGVQDLPYADLNEYAPLLGDMLANLASTGEEDDTITVTVKEEAGEVFYWRNAGNLIGFSFALGQIMWPDYYAFSQASDSLYLNLLRGFNTVNKAGEAQLLQVRKVRERHGHAVTLDLKAYGIPMLAQDGKYLIPLQTLTAFTMGGFGLSMFYNQECLIVCASSSLDPTTERLSGLLSMTDLTDEMLKVNNDPDLTEEERQAKLMELLAQFNQAMDEKATLGKLYSSGPKGDRSPALADYGLRELCLEMDNLYGLKDSHDIDSFAQFFLETGLTSSLISLDSSKADSAIRQMTNQWLDDGHSTFYKYSYLTEDGTLDPAEDGFSKAAGKEIQARVKAVRDQYPEAVPGYYEVGDTAFVTIDVFTYTVGADHYQQSQDGTLPPDTMTDIIEAHRQITREGSPIKNVVLDLSLNAGGMVPPAIYVLGWMLGDVNFSLKDTFSGAETTTQYRADVNLDRVFDEQDTLAGRGLNLYCLISPVSFSCGNLVPWAFKTEGSVKLLGSVTGGGSCSVWPMSTAWGTSFAISGPYRISFMKNGAYYDVDQGVEPDYVISTWDHYYDRDALAAYINGLY